MGWFKKGEYNFEVFKDKKKEWRFRMVAPNGETILTSEGYKNMNDLEDTIAVIIKFAKDARVKYI